ncbi:leucine-rich repeat domain-containing protein [Pseudomonas atacamensis]|uniref:leucine-rich repeat domain-containing protein n=1 Tax=Pseudomonas atacamensis TaxID=2565368 RepID=UPI003808F398
MPVKPPRGGNSHVDASGSPHRSTDADASLQGHLGRRGGDSNLTQDISQPRAGSSSDATIDGVLPSAVVVHAMPEGARPPEPQASLDNYVTNARAILPPVNTDGLRVIGKRIYADLANGDLVPVATDPVTGLYRARRPSELLASGPVLLRNPDTGYWYPRAVVEPTTLAQVRKYLPEIADQDADAFIARFDDKDVAELELKHIQLGLPQLDIKHVSIPYHQNHALQSHEITEAIAMWNTLRQVHKWQGAPDQQVYSNGRLTGYKLDINLTLWPVDRLLSLKFKSVVSLSLRGHAPLDPEVFFAQFPNIESLTIASQMITSRSSGAGLFLMDMSYSRFRVDSRFTEQLKRLPHLRELSLQDCDLQADFSVRDMTRLQVLRLGSTPGPEVNGLPGPLRFGVPVQRQNDFLQTDPDISGMTELRVLDLTGAGIRRIPFGLDADSGRSTLEVLRLGNNALSVAPSLKGMTALQELNLSNALLDKFPEGITDEIPGKVLNLANNRITSIPESVELRTGFNFIGNPITDPASLRRLIHARIKTGTDIWLGVESSDRSANLWLRNVPPLELSGKLKLWDSFGGAGSDVLNGIRKLSRTPEFHVEYPLLQRRVWWFLDIYTKAEPSEQARMKDILINEPSPGKMLDRLEALIREYDSGRQNQPLHHLPKRPKLD